MTDQRPYFEMRVEVKHNKTITQFIAIITAPRHKNLEPHGRRDVIWRGRWHTKAQDARAEGATRLALIKDNESACCKFTTAGIDTKCPT